MAGRRLYDRELKVLVTDALVERLERLRALRNMRVASLVTASDIRREALAAGCSALEAAERQEAGR